MQYKATLISSELVCGPRAQVRAWRRPIRHQWRQRGGWWRH